LLKHSSICTLFFEPLALHLATPASALLSCTMLHSISNQQLADRQPLVKDRAEYERMHKWSVDDPQDFWAHMAHDYYWAKKVCKLCKIFYFVSEMTSKAYLKPTKTSSPLCIAEFLILGHWTGVLVTRISQCAMLALHALAAAAWLWLALLITALHQMMLHITVGSAATNPLQNRKASTCADASFFAPFRATPVHHIHSGSPTTMSTTLTCARAPSASSGSRVDAPTSATTAWTDGWQQGAATRSASSGE
jgi:hypothetical protein